MDRSESSESSPLENLAALDEILQVMYWLRGEGLALEVSASDLTRWIGLGESAIAPLLERGVAFGLLRKAENRAENAADRFALSPIGIKEGGKRFADEFADLTRPGHGECGDPDCDCQRTGNPADCVHHH